MPSFGGISLLNPLLTALSVWAIAAIAQRLWPERREIPVLLLALGSAVVPMHGKIAPRDMVQQDLADFGLPRGTLYEPGG
ncbi:hypothetical protein ACEN2S_04830 [Phaeovulum sp. W22_SRMD_FR3]